MPAVITNSRSELTVDDRLELGGAIKPSVIRNRTKNELLLATLFLCGVDPYVLVTDGCDRLDRPDRRDRLDRRNVGMKELGAMAEAYDAAILEVVGSDATIDDVFARETIWKEKLGTRVKGLNRN